MVLEILPSWDRTRDLNPIFKSHSYNSILESWFSPFRIPFDTNEISGDTLESFVVDEPPDHTSKYLCFYQDIIVSGIFQNSVYTKEKWL